MGEAAFSVLSPYEKEEDKNDSSIVLLAKLGGLSWLLTGDMGEEGERELLSTFPQLQADILKVGHHGSKTSSSTPFLEQLQSKAALISVGKDNRYGHPHGDVIGNLEEMALKCSGRMRMELLFTSIIKVKEPFGRLFHSM